MIGANVRQYKILLEGLSVYRNILEDDVVNRLYKLLNYINSQESKIDEFIKLYNNFYSFLLENNSLNTLEDHFISMILYSDNKFTKTAEIKEASSMDRVLTAAAVSDLRYLSIISKLAAKDLKEFAFENICTSEFEKTIMKNLPEWNFEVQDAVNSFDSDIRNILRSTSDWGECLEHILNFYRENGSGIFAKFTGFVWEGKEKPGKLKGIELLEDIRLSDLPGYENERTRVLDNTLKFLKGYKANNVLLYGDRGTGKSSTVKAILNEYACQGLRMIEIPKAYLTDFPDILDIVKGRRQKFIFFIDDLVFGDNEESYTSLKAMLEGGLETRPDNVVIYATSNRRHLIVEKFSDRSNGALNGDDEIHREDTMQEKLSLADRFGISITFVSPDKKKYLKIVEEIAAKRGLNIDIETLHSEALKWEIRYNGRSPRTARQFIDWLQAQE
jgi:predicted AAA+ superfamily ATPase